MFNFNDDEKHSAISLLIILIVIYLLIRVRAIMLPFVLSIILAYLFNPFIVCMRRRNYTRTGALLLLIIVVFNIIFISSLFLFPIFINELNDLSQSIPKYITAIGDVINGLNHRYQRIQLPEVIQQSFDKFLQEIEQFMINIIRKITSILLNSIPLLFTLILTPIITYYILKDLEDIKLTFYKLVPDSKKTLYCQLTSEANEVFVGFLRGQIWISLIVGVVISIGLFFLKIRFYLLLGILAGITNIIPYIGPIIGGIPAILISLLASPLQALGVFLLYLFVQQIESSIIAPKIMSKRVGLHPLTVIFSLLAGTELLGIWGLLLAVPIAGITKVIIRVLLKTEENPLF